MADPNITSLFDILRKLAEVSHDTILSLWDDLPTYQAKRQNEFHDAATTVLEHLAQAAYEAATEFGVMLGGTGEASDLIVADAAARTYVPFDAMAAKLKTPTGWDYSEVVAAGRDAAEAMAHDAVFRTARETVAGVAGPDFQEWGRAIGPKACTWCISMSTHVWDTAEAATFGHDRCDCVAVPVAGLGDHNSQRYEQLGTTPDQAVAKLGESSQRSKAAKAVQTARRRLNDTRSDLATETDPDRVQRLNNRERQWQTRLDRATQRLDGLKAN